MRSLCSIAAILSEHRDELTKLDMPIGDSDHGINMDRGFKAVVDLLPSLEDASASEILKRAARAVISHVGGSSGPLYGVVLRKLSAAVRREGALSIQSLADGLEAGLAGIEELAGGSPGDKTMIDAMVPAIESLKQSLASGIDAQEALQLAADAADGGAEATIPLIARKGRASYLGERSVGHKDPGAASFALCMAALAHSA